MTTVAERLRRIRSRSRNGGAMQVPSWIPSDVADGPALLGAFQELPPAGRAHYSLDVARLGLRSALPDLIELLRDGPAWVEPAKAIHRLARDEDVPQLLSLLEESVEPEQRQMVIYTLTASRLRPSRLVTDRLLAIASNSREADSVRGHALEAMSSHPPRTRAGRASVLRTVRAALTNASPNLAYNAAWTVGALRLREARSLLAIAARTDTRPYNDVETVADAARAALQCLGGSCDRKGETVA